LPLLVQSSGVKAARGKVDDGTHGGNVVGCATRRENSRVGYCDERQLGVLGRHASLRQCVSKVRRTVRNGPTGFYHGILNLANSVEEGKSQYR
jgi:CRISPR/Cas system-associated protein Csm6